MVDERALEETTGELVDGRLADDGPPLDVVLALEDEDTAEVDRLLDEKDEDADGLVLVDEVDPTDEVLTKRSAGGVKLVEETTELVEVADELVGALELIEETDKEELC